MPRRLPRATPVLVLSFCFALVVGACSGSEGSKSESCTVGAYEAHCDGNVLVDCAPAEDCSHHEDCGFIGCTPCRDYPHVYGTDCEQLHETCVEVVNRSGDHIGARCR